MFKSKVQVGVGLLILCPDGRRGAIDSMVPKLLIDLEYKPDGTFKLTSVTSFTKENVTSMWYSDSMFRYMFKA